MFQKPSQRVVLLATATMIVWASLVCCSQTIAQTVPTGDRASDEHLKAVERERDELKLRNTELENRLRQLQATVDKLVSDAVQSPPASQTAGLRASVRPPEANPPDEQSTAAGANKSGTNPAIASPPVTLPSAPAINPVDPLVRRRLYYSPLGPITSPLQAPADLVSLAVAYQEALAERQTASQSGEAKRFWPNFSPTERKVRLLRSITTVIRDMVGDEVERIHKLAAVHAAPMMDVRNMETKLKILDLILAQDPDAPSETKAPTEKPGK
jgi:hypothetical protein